MGTLRCGWITALLIGVEAVLLQSASADPLVVTNCAAPMPDGFDWPADERVLYQISGGIKTTSVSIPGVIDMVAQRKHGWSLFAGVTQPASTAEGAPPVFHTWYTVEEAFDLTSGKVNCATRVQLLRISLPTQLLIATNNPARDALRAAGFQPSARFDPDPAFLRAKTRDVALDAHEGVVAFSHVAFNQEMYDFLRDNNYYSKATLNSLIDASKARVPIVDPPRKAISLKFSWWPVAPDRLTPVPVWDNTPRFPGDAKNPPTTWNRVILADPVGGLKAPASVQLGGFDHPNPSVVPLGRFYSVRLTDEEATLANADFRIKAAASAVLGRPLQQGDYLVMTAMHIATREFDPWVFVTFWWTDTPNEGSLASDMPAEVKGVFRNYVMDISYNINAPKGSNGKAPVAYNPWLELFQLGGTRSQCMACHSRAAYGPKVVASFNPLDMSSADPNGFEASPQNEADPAFQMGTVSLHRIWTIFTRAQ